MAYRNVPNQSQTGGQLVRGLTLTHSISIIICFVIGAGIFLKTSLMAQCVGSPMLILAAWIVAGLFSLAGALTYAELSAMIPKAGGEYLYLRTAYGEFPAFFHGWTLFVIFPASSAAVGTAFSIFLSELLPIRDVWLEYTMNLFGREILWQFGVVQIVAVSAIVSCAAINSAKVSFSGGVQSWFTFAKVFGMTIILIGVFFFSKEASWKNLTTMPVALDSVGLKGFGAATVAALWAYSGWQALPLVAGEVRDPERNLPRALIAGVLIIIIIYCAVNLAYFYALPLQEIMTSNSTQYPDAVSVAGKAVQTFLGPWGLKLMLMLLLVSTLGTLHSGFLTLPRVTYAMARDRLFFPRFSSLNDTTHIPVAAIAARAILSCVYALAGTFDQLTTLVVFMRCIIAIATGASLFVLRQKIPNAHRPYRALGYPLVPGIFILTSMWLVIDTLRASPLESAWGILLMVLGLPLFYYLKHGASKEYV